MRIFECCLTEEQTGLMIKQVVASLHLSKRLRRAVTESGGVRLNDHMAYWTTRVTAGDVLTIDAPHEEGSASIIPEDIPLVIAFEDEHVLVIDKPAGMVVHPTGTHTKSTLVSAVAYHLQGRQETGMCRPLHRLDRETSGLIVFAKHKLAHERLVRALRARQVTRAYIAYVHGLLPFAERLLELPILRPSEGKLQRAVAPYGKPAWTHVWRDTRYERAPITKVRLRLLTGRTHQIRVHMSHIGYPLIGDWLYGRTPDPWLDRQALHAGELRFAHPIDGRTIELQADLPRDLKDLEARLQAGTKVDAQNK
ncbi:MAG: RluA family pseudouridine synthase [Firmicutes bacterium]|nr:RluA family pseudouridine synthase [Bacillota bacterium]